MINFCSFHRIFTWNIHPTLGVFERAETLFMKFDSENLTIDVKNPRVMNLSSNIYISIPFKLHGVCPGEGKRHF